VPSSSLKWLFTAGAIASLPGIVLACGDDEATSEPGIDLPGRNPKDEAGTAAVDSSSPEGDGSKAPAFVHTPFDINHVLIGGQSNSVANSGTPVLSVTQPFTNLMFDTGVMPMKQCEDGEGCKAYDEPKAFKPLVEGDMFFPYPVETPASGLANQITHLAKTSHGQANHDVLASIHGRSGNTYACLRKTNCNYKPGYLPPFEQAIREVTNAKALAAAAGKTYAVRAVAVIHGESDHNSYTDGSQEFPLDGTDGKPGGTADYSDALVEWQRDYETSIKAVTQQSLPIPLLVSQISGWNDTPMSRVAQWQVDAHMKAPGKVVLIGPSYAIPLRQDDCLHFTNEGERRLGQYFAKVYSQLVFEGKTWEPVRPKTVTRDASVITVVFHVPKPPLVLEQTLINRVGLANEGFAYTDNGAGGAPPAITKVEITAPDTVKITLAAAPTGDAKRLRYAMNQTPGTCIGNPNGARGTLRDSDDTKPLISSDTNAPPLHNWSVHFDVSVP